MIVDKLDDRFLEEGQPYFNILYKALIIMGYYGLLRVGELTSGSHPVLASYSSEKMG